MKMSTVFKIVAVALLWVLIPSLCTAAENKGVKLLKENFDYPANSFLVNNGGWTKYECYYGTPAKDSIQVIAGGLTFPGYQPAAIGNAVRLTNIGSDAQLKFTPQEGTIYVSMLVNVKAADSGNFFFSFGDLKNTSTEGYGKLHVKKVGDKLAFSVTRRDLSDKAVYTDAVYNLNQTYLIVVKYTQNVTDGEVALFINPNPAVAEPASPLLKSKGGMNTSSLLKYITLYQEGKDLKSPSDITVDAIRVASSWEALFDASDVVQLPYINVPATAYAGTYQEGSGKPVNSSIIVKGENLTSDITVKCKTDGYITFKNTTIAKAEAESANGYKLEYTLNPKDGAVQKDEFIFTSGTATSTTSVTWAYFIPTPELEAQDIATVLAAKKLAYYTLVNPVKVTNVEVLPRNTIYTIEDATGSLSFSDDMVLSRKNIKYGDELTNLVIEIQSEPETPSFTPFYLASDSPELKVVSHQSGVKLLLNNFEYEEGNLAGNGNWQDYRYADKNGDPVKTVKGGLDYLLYQDFPVGNSVRLTQAGQSASADFQAVDGSVYSSLLVKVASASEKGNFFYSFGTAEGDGNAQSNWGGYGFVFVKKVGDKLAFGVSQKSTDPETVVYSDAIYNFNEICLLVLKYNLNPGYGDDTAELFVNPGVLGKEPANGLKATASGMEPFKLSYANLYQYTDDNLGASYDLNVDAIRVANSWGALFDDHQVETAPEATLYISDIAQQTVYLGYMIQGSEPTVNTYIIKGKNLRSDLTLSCKSEGYFTFSTTTISKTDAESEKGFELTVTLDPKNGLVTKDTIHISSELLNMVIPAEWGFRAKADKNSVEELKAVNEAGTYRLINMVNVEKIRSEKDEFENETFYYTLKDESGTIEVQYVKGGPGPRAVSTIDDIKEGNNVRNLCIDVDSSTPEIFTPNFVLADSPELEIIVSGIDNIGSDAITGYANGKFTAEGARNIKVFDVNGKRLMEVNGESLEMNALPNAVYLVQYTNEAGEVSTVKVMK